MKGLSITAIGLRPIEACVEIFRALSAPLELEYLELAIGSNCEICRIPPYIPLVLHDRCLYERGRRLPFSLLDPATWGPYIRCAKKRVVLAMSVHPPLLEEASFDLIQGRQNDLAEAMGVPVLLEVMPSPFSWLSHDHLPDASTRLLLDISHINIWHRGSEEKVQATIARLLPYAKGIHLSHNNGRRDSHDLIPQSAWFWEMIPAWEKTCLVTYESLPAEWGRYERRDKGQRPPYLSPHVVAS